MVWGKDVLVPRPSKYPEQFRRDAVELVRSSPNRSLREIGRELGVNHEGEIRDCYWERQNSAGGILDKNFHLGARRVEVTSASSDYAFHSQGCSGPRRPVGE